MEVKLEIERGLGILQREVEEWSHKNFPKNQPDDPFIGVVEEVGELAHAILKLRQGIREDAAELEKKKQDAIGDIVVYLADYCGRNNIDFGYTVATVWDSVSKRDWSKDPKNGGQNATRTGGKKT